MNFPMSHRQRASQDFRGMSESMIRALTMIKQAKDDEAEKAEKAEDRKRQGESHAAAMKAAMNQNRMGEIQLRGAQQQESLTAQLGDFEAREAGPPVAGPVTAREAAIPSPLSNQSRGDMFRDGVIAQLRTLRGKETTADQVAQERADQATTRKQNVDEHGLRIRDTESQIRHRDTQTRGLIEEIKQIGIPKPREAKPMSQGELDDLTLVETAAQTLNDIRDAFGEVSSGKKGPLAGRLAEMNPYDVSVQKLNKLIDSITPALARGVFREVGVLTDKDMERYKSLLPQAKTDPKVAEEVFADLQNKIQHTYSTSIRNLGHAGRDMSGFDESRNLFESKSVGGSGSLGKPKEDPLGLF